MRGHPSWGAGLVLAALAIAGSARADTSRAEDRALRARIVQDLGRIPGVALESVAITVASGTVLIEGSVPVLEHVLRIEQRVWRTQGVDDVENELRVVPRRAVPDAEIEMRIREIVAAEPKFVAAGLKISVSQGAVSLIGDFLNPPDILELKHRVAALEGVLTLWIDAALVARADRGKD